MTPNWEHFVRASSDRFSIFAVPKTGTTSIINWCHQNKLNPKYQSADHDMYFIWRPPYERIVTGLNTGLNAIAKKSTKPRRAPKGPEDVYMEELQKFNDTSDFDTIGSIKHHTVTITCPQFENVFWVHLDQLDLLPEYLNKKYDQNYKPIDHRNIGQVGRSQHSTSYYFTVSEFEELLKEYPQASLAIARRAAQDYLPPDLINLQNPL